ncbi:MAG TPA: GGDEF domain-containing protein [Nitrospiria bacterium]|jgi:GGDEF domain-containing protein
MVIAVAIERKRAEESLADQSIRNSLTNLFNRRHFRVRLEEEILRAKRNKEHFWHFTLRSRQFQIHQ